MVKQGYRDVLQREGDSSGIVFNTNRVVDNNLNKEGFYTSVRQSTEFKNLATNIVKQGYRDILKREGDVGGINDWVAWFVSNTTADTTETLKNNLYNGFRNSQEYKNRFGSTPVKPEIFIPTLTTDSLNLRSSACGNVITTLNKRAIVNINPSVKEVNCNGNNWVSVESGGTKGWVAKNWLQSQFKVNTPGSNLKVRNENCSESGKTLAHNSSLQLTPNPSYKTCNIGGKNYFILPVMGSGITGWVAVDFIL